MASWQGMEKKFGNQPLAAPSLGLCLFGISNLDPGRAGDAGGLLMAAACLWLGSSMGTQGGCGPWGAAGGAQGRRVSLKRKVPPGSVQGLLAA